MGRGTLSPTVTCRLPFPPAGPATRSKHRLGSRRFTQRPGALQALHADKGYGLHSATNFGKAFALLPQTRWGTRAFRVQTSEIPEGIGGTIAPNRAGAPAIFACKQAEFRKESGAVIPTLAQRPTLSGSPETLCALAAKAQGHPHSSRAEGQKTGKDRDVPIRPQTRACRALAGGWPRSGAGTGVRHWRDAPARRVCYWGTLKCSRTSSSASITRVSARRSRLAARMSRWGAT